MLKIELFAGQREADGLQCGLQGGGGTHATVEARTVPGIISENESLGTTFCRFLKLPNQVRQALGGTGKRK